MRLISPRALVENALECLEARTFTTLCHRRLETRKGDEREERWKGDRRVVLVNKSGVQAWIRNGSS